MRVLAVTYANRVPDNDCLYDALAEYVELDRFKISRTQALNLEQALSTYDLLDYDRIVLEVRAKHAISQWKFLWKIPNLVFYEEDTWQNYVSFSKNYGRFVRFYSKAQPIRILHSGYEVALKTRELGFDSHFQPKGYDASKLRNIDLNRDIEMAFIGRVEHSNYVHRKKFLAELAQVEPLQLLRTSSDEEYLTTLNRIRFFISADIGFGEHMIKNFEAMACGCVLFAQPQGLDDAELGLQDMVNVVFYESLDELREKLNILRQDLSQAAAIAEKGQRIAEANHNHQTLGKCYYDSLAKPAIPPNNTTWEQGSNIASKTMSQAFFNQHWHADQVVEDGAQLSIAERGLTFRFFAKQPWHHIFSSDAFKKFVEQNLLWANLGIPVPKIHYWGQQQELNLNWVAHDSVVPVSQNTPLTNTHSHTLLRAIAALHQNGYTVSALHPTDLAIDQDNNLIWQQPHINHISNAALDRGTCIENLRQLLDQETDQSNGLLSVLGTIDESIDKYSELVNTNPKSS